MESRRFAGKTAIVTGGNRGIGRAIAERLAGEGADVMIVARSQTSIAEAVDAITATGGRAWGHPADVTKTDELSLAVETASSRWPKIDVLVNNAGIAHETPFLDVSETEWDTVLATNLKAPFYLSQLVASRMVSTGGGVILHIASIDASGANGPFVTYNAAKAGLLGLSRTMAVELAQHSIRVNCVSPGFTRTEMTVETTPPGLMDYMLHRFDRVPLRRLVEPSEVAAACAYLASDDAQAVTGTNFTVDGGLSADLYVFATFPDSERE